MKVFFSSIVIALCSLGVHAQWTSLSSGVLVELGGVHVLDEDSYLVGGEGGILLRTDDGGDTWSTDVIIGGGDLGTILRLDANTLLMAADDGMVARSTDNGDNWTLIQTPAPNVIYDITSIGDLVWASGRDGGLVHSTDKGLTWTAQNSGTQERLHGIHALNANDLVAVGREGVLLRSDNGGATWQLSIEAGGEDLRGVLFLDDVQQTGLIAGLEGELLRSTDQGTNWMTITLPTLLGPEAMASEDPDLVYAVGENALILRSTDQGQTWEEMTTTAFSELSAIDVKDGVAVAVGANGTIIKYDPGASTSVGEAIRSQALNVFPNPSAGRVNIEWIDERSVPAGASLEIRLIDGRLVDRRVWPAGKQRAIIELDAGNYVVSLIGPEGTMFQRNLLVTGAR